MPCSTPWCGHARARAIAEARRVLVLVGVAVPAPPVNCAPRQVLAVLRGLSPRGPLPRVDVLRSQGYSPGYPWDDYRAMVQYVREHVPAETRVANVLVARSSDNPLCQSLNGMVGRRNVFPVESGIIWAFSVRPDDMPKLAAALERVSDSVVVWSPSLLDERSRDHLAPLAAMIREKYEPGVAFGAIELWRRREASGPPREREAGSERVAFKVNTDQDLDSVDLIWLGDLPPAWPLGQAFGVEASPRGVAGLMGERTLGHDGGGLAVLGRFARPARSGPLQPRPGAARGRLALRPPAGHGGAPGVIDHIDPTWMLNADADRHTEATSWRISLRACLVRTEVLRALGGVRPEFQTLDGAALELGHRYIRRGALVRHVPWMLEGSRVEAPRTIPLEDELRWAYFRADRFWTAWAAWRSVAVGRSGPFRALSALRVVLAAGRPADPPPLVRPATGPDRADSPAAFGRLRPPSHPRPVPVPPDAAGPVTAADDALRRGDRARPDGQGTPPR